MQIPPPEQPTFPQTRLDVQEQGVVIMIILAPGTQITQVIPEETMNDITAKWLETRKKIKREMAIIHDINRSKIN